MGEDPVLRGGNGDDEEAIAELLLDEEEDKSGRRRIIIIIIIILLLLLLFWPVSPGRLRDERQSVEVNRELSEKQRNPGQAKYEVISSIVMPTLRPNIRKGVPVGVWFYVTNISRRAEVLDSSMVTLRDQFGVEYDVFLELTEEAYDRDQLTSPWDQDVAPGQRVKALAVFIAYSGPEKQYFLVGRDFEWTSGESKEYDLGRFAATPLRPYMEPDQ